MRSDLIGLVLCWLAIQVDAISVVKSAADHKGVAKTHIQQKNVAESVLAAFKKYGQTVDVKDAPKAKIAVASDVLTETPSVSPTFAPTYSAGWMYMTLYGKEECDATSFTQRQGLRTDKCFTVHEEKFDDDMNGTYASMRFSCNSGKFSSSHVCP